jgi:hypothetical protein
MRSQKHVEAQPTRILVGKNVGASAPLVQACSNHCEQPRNSVTREHERDARAYTPAEAACVFTGTDPPERFTFNSRSDITWWSAGFEK